MIRNAPAFLRSMSALVLATAAAALAFSPAAFAQEQQGNAAKGDRASKPTASLPNGAISISETYGDWNVSCRIDNGAKSCVFSQAQGDTRTGRQVFAVELRVPKDGKTEGVLLLPFGLKLDDGVKLKIDEQNLGQGARFSSCYPQGCIVPVSFPTVATDAMQKGTSLIVTATDAAGGETPTFKVSLNGFTDAINRTVELAK